MKRIFKHETVLVESRFIWASVLMLIAFCVLILRLWYLQIYRGSFYKQMSENNRIRRIEIPAPRGNIYDRNGKVLLTNRVFYDLVYIPQYVSNREVTFNILSRLLHIPVSQLEKRIRIHRKRPEYMPITLKRNLSLHEVSIIESNKVILPGIAVNLAPRREYYADIPSHLIGYLGEIDDSTLKTINEVSSHKYYSGDLIGKQGIEAKWEEYLKGHDGYKLIQVDAHGRRVKSGEKYLQLPQVYAQVGASLELTIDMDLQLEAQRAFKNKYGAIIAMNPQNGQVLAMVSSPNYDPSIYQQSISKEDWSALVNDPHKPLFDKTTGGEYIPGSIYKTVVAIAALEEGIITPTTTHRCSGSFTLGNNLFYCHKRSGHGVINLREALMYSCDVFFYMVGIDLGVNKIAEYAKKLGLGSQLGLNINLEKSGNIPTSEWKKQKFNQPWHPGDTPNVAIGQGYNLMTPLQMVSLYSVVANGGTIWRPYVVQKVVNQFGDVIKSVEPEVIATSDIKPETFKMVRDYLKDVVMNPLGTGSKARVPGVTVAGKTGSAQVVSLKKADKYVYDDINDKWKEHAIFAAFSPSEQAEIVVVVVSENDEVGGGGSQAAPIAKRIIEKYWSLKKNKTVDEMLREVNQKTEEKVKADSEHISQEINNSTEKILPPPDPSVNSENNNDGISDTSTTTVNNDTTNISSTDNNESTENKEDTNTQNPVDTPEGSGATQ